MLPLSVSTYASPMHVCMHICMHIGVDAEGGALVRLYPDFGLEHTEGVSGDFKSLKK